MRVQRHGKSMSMCSTQLQRQPCTLDGRVNWTYLEGSERVGEMLRYVIGDEPPRCVLHELRVVCERHRQHDSLALSWRARAPGYDWHPRTHGMDTWS